ncbi:MAG TPA: class I SAM-dependent methyltransferase [Phycisphaerales bacterium]|nr:class I SAM-dependent methyltransferase [Phycisphaerales bacterium]
MFAESPPTFLLDESPDREHFAEIRALSETHNLPVIQSLRELPATAATLLVRTQERLELRTPSIPHTNPLFVDLAAPFHADAASRSINQPLARAVGKQNRPAPHSMPGLVQGSTRPSEPASQVQQPYIIDCTAGFAVDSALLLSLGFSILAIERNPILVALLNDGVRRALLDPLASPAIASRFRILHADARNILPTLSPPAAVAYIDPMFPPKRKSSALPPRRAQVLRQLVGDDLDSAPLIAVARSLVPRVLVKQPHEAPPLFPPPTATITTKLLRYDICNHA